MVRTPPQPGSPQSRSLTLTTVSSSALMTVRACSFNSSAASLRRFEVFRGKKKAAMCVRQPDSANLAASQTECYNITYRRSISLCAPWHRWLPQLFYYWDGNGGASMGNQTLARFIENGHIHRETPCQPHS